MVVLTYRIGTVLLHSAFNCTICCTNPLYILGAGLTGAYCLQSASTRPSRQGGQPGSLAFPTSPCTSWMPNPTTQPPHRHGTSPPQSARGLATAAGHLGSSPRRPMARGAPPLTPHHATVASQTLGRLEHSAPQRLPWPCCGRGGVRLFRPSGRGAGQTDGHCIIDA